MRKLIFTAILLLVLGITWVLYLEHGNRNFVENLPKASTTVTRTGYTTEPPAVSENSDITAVNSAPAEASVKPTSAEKVHAHPPGDSLEPTGETAVPLEDAPSEQSPGNPRDPSLKTEPPELEKRFDAMATLNEIRNSAVWLRGNPYEAGAIFTLSRSEQEKYLKANYFLNPTQANKEALENFGKTPVLSGSESVTSPETHDVIHLDGFSIHVRKGFLSTD